MKNAGRLITVLLFLAGQTGGMYAQNLPVVAVYPVTSQEVGEHVAKTVNDLVFSFVRELRNYKILDLRADSVPEDLGIPEGTNYLFYGRMTGQSDGIKLELVLKGGPDSVTRLISRVYENSNRILLESRSLVRDLFDQTIALPDPVQPSQDNNVTVRAAAIISLDSLAGSWYGENGIEKVLILRGGRGVAVLTSGVSISLELTLSGSELTVRQKGALNPRQFDDLSDSVARQAASVVPPPEWVFSVSPDLSLLVGSKKTVIVKNDGKNILTVENVVQDVSWSRN